MDLGTVKKNLKANKYKFVEDALHDVFLVWENCKTYNAQGSVSLSFSKETHLLSGFGN